MSRRTVRVDPSSFDDLDAQLGAGRGPNGEVSSTDLLVMDLPTIVDRFAEDFETLAVAYAGRDDYRVLVSTGTLIATSVVIGRLLADDTIALMGIDIELGWPPNEDQG